MAIDEESRKLTEDKVKCLLESESSTGDKEKIKVLVVEDDHTTQLLYDKGLFNQIFDKRFVASGKEALLIYDEWHPDIIILDIYLLEMTGYDVLKDIRETIEDKETTIVMATSLSDKEDVLSCIKLGIEGYILKPFTLREIGAMILGYYAKNEPERARKADELCRELLKQSQAQRRLDQGKSTMKENPEGFSSGISDAQTAGAMREKETGETPVEKLKD